ncbi:hypothetical protein [Comamonas thiooxydans]|uniref:hypothetical protein n=1 Tax=Comamonas thiooxydans TaxID=363952 RepID=UPI000B41621C|nr:hypothetical protein [Comamonas thiooxydans]
MLNHTVTLSRAHKIAERLTSLISEAKTVSDSSFGLANISLGVARPLQVKALQAKSQAGLAALKRGKDLCEALATVRSAIAAGNVKAGVQDLLTRQDCVRRKLAMTRDAITAASRDGLPVEELMDLPIQTGDVIPSYLVSPLSPSELSNLKADLKALELEFNSLSDQISDANTARIEFSLPDEISDEVIGAQSK